MTEQLDGTAQGAGPPGIATASYAADEVLLAELRAAWPTAAVPGEGERGYITTDLDGSEPAAVLKITRWTWTDKLRAAARPALI